MNTRQINWVEVHGQAHIVREDQFLDSTLCGASLADSTIIDPGTDLDGCIDCICAHASKHTEQRPVVPPVVDGDWQ